MFKKLTERHRWSIMWLVVDMGGCGYCDITYLQMSSISWDFIHMVHVDSVDSSI